MSGDRISLKELDRVNAALALVTDRYSVHWDEPAQCIFVRSKPARTVDLSRWAHYAHSEDCATGFLFVEPRAEGCTCGLAHALARFKDYENGAA